MRCVVYLSVCTSAVETAYKMDEFFKHESCGKCTPCREGTTWLTSVLHRMANGHGRLSHSYRLEDYIESKLGDFVKGMKNGSARNLYPMLIRAVERPLITLALKETNGNQIQAAHLLGMNRNTLRKKITDLRIPIKREKARVV